MTAQQVSASATEQYVADIWCSVLNVPEVSVTDNFFDLGGHSLLLHMVHERLGGKVPLVELFARPTVRGVAAYLDHGRR